MKKRSVLLALAGVMATILVTGCGSINGDETAVTVNDTELTADVANFYVRYNQAQYESYMAAYLGEDMWNSEAAEGQTYEESVKDRAKESLENMLLLEQHMSDYEVSLSDSEKKVIEETAQKFDEANALEEKEKISGDKKVVERVLTLMAIEQKMTAVIQAEADPEVSDEEAAQKAMSYAFFSYETTDEEGQTSTLSDEEKEAVKTKAVTLAEGLKAGGDITALAGEAGVEVSTVTFDKKSESPNADFIKAADVLEEGGSTDVIETEKGCYVGKVTSLLDRAATDAKKESILSERKTKLYEDTCAKWRDESDIKAHKNVWKKIDFNDMSVTMVLQEDMPYTEDVKTDDQVDLDAEE